MNENINEFVSIGRITIQAQIKYYETTLAQENIIHFKY